MDLCKVIFEKYKIPIIMLTAVDKDQNRITAYNSGARFYNTKPISSELLISQVKAIFREGNRKSWDNDYRYVRFHAWELDLLDRNIKQYGVSRELSNNEYNVLTLLLEHAYKTVSRNQLVKRIYNRSYSGTDDRAVDMIIARLRKKLEREDDREKLIRTIHSQGYMIACEVEFCE